MVLAPPPPPPPAGHDGVGRPRDGARLPEITRDYARVQVKTAWVAAIGDNDQEMRLEVCVPTPVVSGNLGQSRAISRDLA